MNDEALPTVTAACLFYDIKVGSKIPNPSPELRRLGFRANLSCWVIPHGAMPWNLIHDLNKKGANAKVVKFDASEGPKLVAMALSTLKNDIAAQVKRCRANILKAAEKHLAEAETPEERELALARYEMRAEAICKKLETLIEDSVEAIKTFGVNPDALSLTSARSAFEAFQVGYAAKAAEYAAATEALRDAAKTTPGDGTLNALANAAAADALPPEVAADALREAGNEKAADRLQKAFDPETFSLADASDE